MATIVMGELGAFAAQAQVAGPDLSLNDKAAQTMALLVHELATNASKHGAWSESEGTVAIRWNIDANGAEPRVTFAWVEHGGPPAEPPASRGFGTTLMRQVVAMEFDAEPDLSYTNKGFRYEFSAPIVKILMGAATLSSRRTA
jgi:two-component sensor histidine kinase